jgi:aubergine-like protein
MNPKHTFYNHKQGKNVSYMEYFQTCYGVKIKIDTQPLIKVKNPQKNKGKEDPMFIYLIPELVNLTGLTDEQRSDWKVMKSVGEFTKLTATKRMAEIKSMRDRINKDDDILFEIAPEPRALNGYVFDSPEIRVGKQKSIQAKQGSINIRENILDPYRFKSIVFCYSVTSASNGLDIKEADYALDTMI